MPRHYAGLGPSRVRTRTPSTRRLGQWVSLRKILRFHVRYKLSQTRCLSLLLAMSSRLYLLFPPRDHEPPPTLRDRLNPHLSLQRRRFPIPRYAKRPDVALSAIGPLFLLPTSSSPQCTLKVSEHDSLCGSRPPLIRMSALAHKSILVRSVVSLLSHRVISRVRLYEVIRWSGLLRYAPIM